MSYTGVLLDYLEELHTSGFISRDYTWHFSSGKLSRFNQFRLSDNYVRFYLKYIDPVIPNIENDAFQFKSICSLPGWQTIMGYQCENLLLKNRSFIRDQLNILPDTIVTDNPFFQKKTKKYPGCQVDYLIQTKTNNLYLCEFKFSKQPIGSQVIKEIQQKVAALVRPKGFSVFPVLIHVNGVHNSVEDSQYFTKIIDFSEILRNRP